MIAAEEEHDLEPKDLQPFCAEVLDSVRESMTAAAATQGNAARLEELLDDAGQDELKQLRKRFIFSYVDKFQSKFVLICRQQYARL